MTSQAELAVILSARDRYSRELANAQKGFGKVAASAQRAAGQMRQAGAGLVALGGAGTAAFVGAGKAAIEFESSFAGVRKTVDASEAEFQAIRTALLQMSKEIPVNVNELARIAEAAGQLGIEKESILEFTRTMADLGVATNLTAEEAATSLARFANITQLPQSEIRNLGSAIVALGNTSATTEAEIVQMGLRLAGAGNQAGLAEAQILGIAAALSSVGLRADAGGTAFSRVLLEMNSAVKAGAAATAGFADVAGVSAEQFAATFEKDASEALLLFLDGLSKLQGEGADVAAVLDDLSFGEIRVRDALLRASGAGDLFRDAINQGSQAFMENNALSKEAAQRYGTAASQIEIMKNKVNVLAINVGEKLIPHLLPLIDKVGVIAEKMLAWAEAHPTLIKVLAVVAVAVAGVGAVLVTLGLIIPPIVAVIGLFAGATLAAILPIVLIVAAIVGLIAIGVLLWKNWDTIKAKAIEIWTAIKEWFVETWEFLVQLFKDNWDIILAILFPPVGLVALIANRWGQIKEVVAGIWESVKETVTGAINFMIGKINGFIDRVNSIRINIPRVKIPLDGTVGGGSVGFPKIPSIPKLEHGIRNFPGGLAMVGERGPELVGLPRGSSVFSNRESRQVAGGRDIHIHMENATINGIDDMTRFVTRALKRARRLGADI